MLVKTKMCMCAVLGSRCKPPFFQEIIFMNIASRVSNVWTNFVNVPECTIAVLTCVIVFSVLYFFLLRFLINNNAAWLVVIFVFAVLLGGAVVGLTPGMSGSVFVIVPAVFVLLVIILYATEIKRMIWAYKNLKLLDVKHSAGRSIDEEKTENCISEIIKALQNMAKKNTGAIIVLAAGEVPGQILDSGIKLESDISSELIESVFVPKTPLHDGAMIISGTKILAAGCFLPLSHNDNIPKDLGTRHRAGIGITETIDVMSLIVSEETGIISIAREGKITRYADADILRKTLNKYYWQELESARK